jgi:hypothetical protein
MCVIFDELFAEVKCRPHIEVATARDHLAVWTSFLTRNRKTCLLMIDSEAVNGKVNVVDKNDRKVFLWDSSDSMTDTLFSVS